MLWSVCGVVVGLVGARGGLGGWIWGGFDLIQHISIKLQPSINIIN
jgi:hypothetical protein